jgi:hypothetical protein
VCAFHTRTLPTFQGDGKIEARKQEKTGRGERPAGCSSGTAVLKNGRKISYGLSYTPETFRISLRHGYEDVKLSYELSYYSAADLATRLATHPRVLTPFSAQTPYELSY